MTPFKKNLIGLLIITASALAIWAADVVSDRRHLIAILKPVALLENPPQNYPANNRQVGTLAAGEKVTVLRVGYGKDFRTWKVRGAANQEGWFVEELDTVKVLDN